MTRQRSIERLTDEQILKRLDWLEGQMKQAANGELPTLNRCFEALIAEQVRRDIERMEPQDAELSVLP